MKEKQILPDESKSPRTCSGSQAGSYLRLIVSCITQLKAQPVPGAEEEAPAEVHGPREVDGDLGFSFRPGQGLGLVSG